jgi:hypothetical protein
VSALSLLVTRCKAASVTDRLSSVCKFQQPFFQEVEGCEYNGLSVEFV